MVNCKIHTNSVASAPACHNSEVLTKPRQRRLTAENKPWILGEVFKYLEPGEISALLKCEGLCSPLFDRITISRFYASHLRLQRHAAAGRGSAPSRAGTGG